jgi:hypothetical protein
MPVFHFKLIGDKYKLWWAHIPLSIKVGTKFCRQVAIAQSVVFARRLRAMEFLVLYCGLYFCSYVFCFYNEIALCF